MRGLRLLSRFLGPRRGWPALGVVLLVAVAVHLLGLTDGLGKQLDRSEEDLNTSAPVQEGTYRAGELDLDELLEQVEVHPSRPDVDGYDRKCGTEHACSFGQPWSDDVEVKFGHNGCDTRNDLLRTSLRDIETRPGTHECVIVAGTLADPYTGEQLQFRKAAAHEIAIDHLYPLARAWDMGAAEWTDDQRRTFANDPRNLIAVSGPANSSKQDLGPGEWMPINAAYRCTYLVRYLEVSLHYRLPVTQTDHDTAEQLTPYCQSADERPNR